MKHLLLTAFVLAFSALVVGYSNYDGLPADETCYSPVSSSHVTVVHDLNDEDGFSQPEYDLCNTLYDNGVGLALSSIDDLSQAASEMVMNHLPKTQVEHSEAEESPSQSGSHLSEFLKNQISEHLENMVQTTRRLHYLAFYSDLSSQDDSRYSDVMERIHELNNERECLISLLNAELGENDQVEYSSIVSGKIVPAWDELSDKQSWLDYAIQARDPENEIGLKTLVELEKTK